MKCSLGISNLLGEISSLPHSVVFLYFFALIAEESFLISPFYSLELCIQMLVSFLFSSVFHFFSQLLVRPLQTAILPFCISFPWGWSWSLSPVQCHEPHSIVHQALPLSDRVIPRSKCILTNSKKVILLFKFYRRQESRHPQEKEMQKSKMAVWGGFTNSCEKKRSQNQRRKEKIYSFECRAPNKSKER